MNHPPLGFVFVISVLSLWALSIAACKCSPHADNLSCKFYGNYSALCLAGRLALHGYSQVLQEDVLILLFETF